MSVVSVTRQHVGHGIPDRPRQELLHTGDLSPQDLRVNEQKWGYWNKCPIVPSPASWGCPPFYYGFLLRSESSMDVRAISVILGSLWLPWEFCLQFQVKRDPHEYQGLPTRPHACCMFNCKDLATLNNPEAGSVFQGHPRVWIQPIYRYGFLCNLNFRNG